jgi:hypothetical protein
MTTGPIKEVSELKKYDEEDIEHVFATYLEAMGKIAEASASLKQASEKIAIVNKAIRDVDYQGDLNLTRKLRMKIVFGIVFPACQHLDRLLVRMKACASLKDDTLSEINRPGPAFE